MSKGENHLAKFITKILKEFQEYFPLDTICKLIVIYGHSYGKSHQSILSLLDKKLTEMISMREFSDNDIQHTRKVYYSKDRKKINFLKKYTTIDSLLKCIEYKTFIHAVLEKYPYPVMVGFPFYNWTEKRIRKYLRLYFSMPNSKKYCKNKLPKPNSIRNIMKNSGIENDYLYNYTLKDIVKHYYKTNEKSDFFYLYTRKEHYKVSEKDQLAPKKKHRYNETFFSTSICLTDDWDVYKQMYSLSYNTEEEMINFENIFYKYSEDVPQKPCSKKTWSYKHTNMPILILDISDICSELTSYYKDLTCIPQIPLIIFEDFQELLTAFKSVGLENVALNLESLQKKLEAMKNVNMDSRSDKEKFIKSLYSKIEDLSDTENLDDTIDSILV